MLGIRYLSLTVITKKAIPGKWVFETSLLCTKCCLKIFHDLITADQTQLQPTKSVLQQDLLHYATLLVDEWTWSVYSDGISLEDIPCRQSKNKQPYPRLSNWNSPNYCVHGYSKLYSQRRTLQYKEPYLHVFAQCSYWHQSALSEW